MNRSSHGKASRIIALFSVFLLTPTFLSACSGGIRQVNDSLTMNTPLYNQEDRINQKTTMWRSLLGNYTPKTPGGEDLDVELLDYGNLNDDDSRKKLNAELMAGDGPDILFMDPDYLLNNDVVKMMRGGAFADMSEYFNADEEFNWDGYYAPIMDEGVVDGKRYIIPLAFRTTTFVSTQSALESSGFAPAQCKDFYSFLEECAKQPADQRVWSNAVFHVPGLSQEDPAILSNYLESAGNLVDSKKGTADWESPDFRRAIDLYKDIAAREAAFPDPLPGEGISERWANNLMQGSCVWGTAGGWAPKDANNVWAYVVKKAAGDVTIQPLRGADGGTSAQITLAVAVRNNSANKQNAYEFIKFLLKITSQVTLTNHGQYNYASLPVSAEAMKLLAYDDQNNETINSIYSYNGWATAVPRTDEECEAFLSDVESVTQAYFHSVGDNLIMEQFVPYFKGEDTYENCLESAKKAYERYVSE